MFQTETKPTIRNSVMKQISRHPFYLLLCLISIASLLSTNGAALAQGAPVFTPQEREWIRQNPVISFASDQGVPPIEYVEKGQYKGMVAAYLKAASAKSGLRFEHVATDDWQGAQQAFRAGKVQLLPYVNGYRLADLPAAKLLLTEPYFNTPSIIVTQADEPVALSIDELKGKVVALYGTAAFIRIFSAIYPRIQVLPTRGPEDALEAVASGRAYATIGMDATFLPLMRRKYVGSLNVAATMSHFPYIAQMAVRSDAPLLHSILDKSLRSLSAEETDLINEQWIAQVDYGAPSLLSIIKYHSMQLILACLGAALLFFFAWRAHQSEKAKSRFLAAMSHDIRTPLHAIMGNLELLGRSPLSEEQTDRLNTITLSSETLLSVINDILDFSKIESDQMHVESIRFDMAETIGQTVAAFEALADAKGLALYYAVDPLLCRYYRGDPARIRQILSNLVSNAVKFTETGKITIDVRSHDDGKRGASLTVSVTDTGIGISPLQQQKIFDPFSQADSSISRRFGGTGLGLALCKRVTELMHGTLTVQSSLGTGSTFSVTLPLAADHTVGDRPEIFSDALQVTLLCASEEWQTAVGNQLRAWGLNVRTAQHPRELDTAELPLIIFGNPRPWSFANEEAAGKQAPWVVDAREDGPGSPIMLEGRLVVSCYSLNGLRQAISKSMGGQAHEPTAPVLIHDQIRDVRDVRLLVAEDNPFNRSLIREQLETLGCSADIVESGVMALRHFDTSAYDLVLTDLSMPDMSGYALAERLRSRAASLPIVAITAHADAAELRRCQQSGIVDVLSKPTSLDQIDRMIRKHLDIPSVPVARAGTTLAPDSAQSPLREDLLAVLLSTCNELTLRAHDALKQNDLETVLNQIHSMKGSFAMIQEHDAVTACSRMEALGRDGKLEELAVALKQFPAFSQEVVERRTAAVRIGKVD